MAEMASGSGLSENLINEDDLKASYAKDVSVRFIIIIIIVVAVAVAAAAIIVFVVVMTL